MTNEGFFFSYSGDVSDGCGALLMRMLGSDLFIL